MGFTGVMHAPHRGLRPKEAAALVVLAALWGASFVFIKVAVDEVGPVPMAAGRLCIGSLVIGGWLLLRHGWAGTRAMVPRVGLRRAVPVAATGSVFPFLLIGWAETDITSSLAGILFGTAPLFAALLLLCLPSGDGVRGWRLAGIVLGFVGVTFVAGGDRAGGSAAIGAVLLGACSYASSALLVRRWFLGSEPGGVALLQATLGAAICVPLAVVAGFPDGSPPAGSVAAVLALGVGANGIGYFLFYFLIHHAGPQQAVAVSYLSPVATVLYGRLLLDEELGGAALLGMVLILTGQVITATPSRNRANVSPTVPPLAPEAGTAATM
jgi:drug/metabolite transporter (DMT)-like permease